MLTKVDSNLCVYWCESNKHDYFADIEFPCLLGCPLSPKNIALMRCKNGGRCHYTYVYVFMVRGVVGWAADYLK